MLDVTIGTQHPCPNPAAIRGIAHAIEAIFSGDPNLGALKRPGVWDDIIAANVWLGKTQAAANG